MFIAQLTKSADEGGNGATLCYIGDIVGLQVVYCRGEATPQLFVRLSLAALDWHSNSHVQTDFKQYS